MGTESTKHNCLCKDMAKFLLKASIRVLSAGAAHIYNCIVFRSGTIRKSVQAVDEKQDISLLWPNILCVELVEMPPSKIL